MAKLAQTRPRTLDGETLIVKQAANAQEQLDILTPVQALARARFLRLDGAELGLPVAQHVGLDGAQPCRLTDLEEGPVRYARGIRRLGSAPSQGSPPPLTH